MTKTEGQPDSIGLDIALIRQPDITGETLKKQQLERSFLLKLMTAFRTHGFTVDERLTSENDEKKFQHTRDMPMFLKGSGKRYEGNLFVQRTPEQNFFQMPIRVKEPKDDDRALTFGYGISGENPWLQWIYHYTGERRFEEVPQDQQIAFLEELLQAEPDTEKLQQEFEEEQKRHANSRFTEVYWNREHPEQAFSQMT